MNENLKNEKAIREYLLGRVSDETLLAEYEELLFLDEDFCSLAEIVEDELINDFVFGKLSAKDSEDFSATLECNPQRRDKIALTRAIKTKANVQTATEKETKPSFFDSFAAFFQKPLNIGAFAVLLVGVFALTWFVLNRQNTDEIADLKSIYNKERPTETRLSEFDYAPLVVTRGAAEEREKNKLRIIENNLLTAVEKNPTAQTHHALGIFYLTQRKFSEAIPELEKAVKLNEKDARIRNDLGSAYFEFAKSGAKERKLENLARANEEFSKAIEFNRDFLPALFNKALCLQELDLPQQAKEAWGKYLEKDTNSKWSEEARKNLEKISSTQSLFKSKEKILEDFLAAYRNKDDPVTLKIHNETKGYLSDVSIPLLLSRRYLEARQMRNTSEARESLAALDFIGGFEREKHADFFVADLADYYRDSPDESIEKLLEAKDLFENGLKLIAEYKYEEVIREFEKSRDAFQASGNEVEANIAEIWAAQFLPDVSRIEESRRRLHGINEFAERKNYKILQPTVLYWLSVSDYRQNRFSESIKNVKTALKKALETENLLEIEHSAESLAGTYAEIGETEKTLALWGEIIRPDAYLQSKTQYWRNKGNLADLMLKIGFLSTAGDAAHETVLIAKEILPKADLTDASLRRLAIISAERKNFETALNAVEESRQIAENREESEQNDFSMAENYLLRGDIERRMQNCDAALGDYEKSLEFFGKISEFTVSLYDVHKGKLLCMNALKRQTEFQTELDAVLKMSEEYRQKIREDESRQAFFGNEQTVFDTAIENALAMGDTKKAFEFAETSRARSLLDFVQSKKSIAETEREFADVSKPLALNEIQARLPDNVQILQFAVLHEKTAVWLITKNRFEFSEQPFSDEELEKQTGNFRKMILEKNDQKTINETAGDLFNKLIPANLDKTKILCIIPDKSLNLLPFAALFSPEGKYLIEDFPIIYGASSTVFMAATENAEKKEKFKNETILSIGNPAFDRAENPALADLPEAETEARTIIRNYPKGVEFTGENATRRNFLDNVENAEIIHFAGHFVVNSRSPGNSKLLFADADLRSNELAERRLSRSKLVVLSACDTGFERFNKSEGSIGAARSFLAMGTPLVVAGNWKVDSEASKDLMISFHRNRREKNLSSAESLRQVQIEMLRGNENNQPYYWAAFNLFGGFANY
jgi:CHAT domain-containing protein